mmetsp:Transcript_20310/g.59891  ORF Transcript_20310/g.59891 Transcript_20310/m.59891 type:complete len:272 (+) Transcript_20310:628-1443(+)
MDEFGIMLAHVVDGGASVEHGEDEGQELGLVLVEGVPKFDHDIVGLVVTTRVAQVVVLVEHFLHDDGEQLVGAGEGVKVCSHGRQYVVTGEDEVTVQRRDGWPEVDKYVVGLNSLRSGKDKLAKSAFVDMLAPGRVVLKVKVELEEVGTALQQEKLPGLPVEGAEITLTIVHRGHEAAWGEEVSGRLGCAHKDLAEEVVEVLDAVFLVDGAHEHLDGDEVPVSVLVERGRDHRGGDIVAELKVGWAGRLPGARWPSAAEHRSRVVVAGTFG